MLFSSRKWEATWDTWLYVDKGMYYLYYLIARNKRWEGFGVAVSQDGVYFRDLGEQLSAGGQMKHYLGTGAVWRFLPDPDVFICNYSEWRELEGGLSQQIYFAHSKDLTHWEKYGEGACFPVDASHYRVYQHENARWDCIYPWREETGYIGVWTATPHSGHGIGIGRSADGLAWRALPPPVILPSPFDGLPLEAGAITRHRNQYYLLIGCYSHPMGMGIFTADAVTGPFAPQPRSFALFANQDKMNAYFARFVETPEGTLVNFHVLLQEKNADGQPKTYLAPLKKAHFDDQGTLRLRWWHGNDKLIGKACTDVCRPCMMIMKAAAGSRVALVCRDGVEVQIRLLEQGKVEIWQNDMLAAHTDRSLEGESAGEMHILLRDTMIEVYWKEWFMLCYTLPAPVHQASGTKALAYKALRLEEDEASCGNNG